MLDAIKYVSENQLARYVTGELSEVTEKMLQDTKGCSPHNVWAERVLGTFNALWNRGKQASVNNVAVKVQLGTNGILDWLKSMPLPNQMKLVDFAVTFGARLRKAEVERNSWLRTQASFKLVKEGQVRDGKKGKLFEGKIVEVLKKGLVSGMFNFPEFMNLQATAKEIVHRIVEQRCIIKTEMMHDWEMGDGSTEPWYGIVTAQRNRPKSGLVTYTVEYHMPGIVETKQNTPMFAEKLVSDILLGDLRFIQVILMYVRFPLRKGSVVLV